MKTNRKLFAGVMGFILSLTAVLAYMPAPNALAADKTDLLSFRNCGVGFFLEPKSMNTAEELSAMAEKLNVSLSTMDDEEISTLVMANVKKELNIRSEANEDAEVVGYLYKDCGGDILERKDGWTKLRSGNLVGWASDEFLLFDEEADTLANDVGKLIATVNVETLRVRKAAADDAKVFGLLPEGEMVDVLDKDTTGEWIRIDYEGKDGYVASEYVTLTFRIDSGETVDELKARQKKENESKRYVNYGEFTVDTDTTLLLAALIQCEAGGEPYEGQVAVGAVVMNRVRCPAYPNTIPGVIYASGQFTPAMSGKVDRVYQSGNIYASCIQAAEEALSGTSNVGDRLYFRRNNGREGLVIGNHVFY